MLKAGMIFWVTRTVVRAASVPAELSWPSNESDWRKSHLGSELSVCMQSRTLLPPLKFLQEQSHVRFEIKGRIALRPCSFERSATNARVPLILRFVVSLLTNGGGPEKNRINQSGEQEPDRKNRTQLYE